LLSTHNVLTPHAHHITKLPSNSCDNTIILTFVKSRPHVHPSPRQSRHHQIGSVVLERADDHLAAFPQRPADLHDVPRPTWRLDQLERSLLRQTVDEEVVHHPDGPEAVGDRPTSDKRS